MRERGFYLKSAKRTKNPLGRAMFQQIGDEDLEHYVRLKQLHKKVCHATKEEELLKEMRDLTTPEERRTLATLVMKMMENHHKFRWVHRGEEESIFALLSFCSLQDLFTETKVH